MCLNGKDSTMKRTLLGILTGLACHAHGGDFTVQLITPPDRILEKEYTVDIRVAISNGTDSAIQIVDLPGIARGAQLFFTILPQNLMEHAVYEKRLHAPSTNWWEKITTTNTWNTKRVRTLAPGQAHEWDFGDFMFPAAQSLIDVAEITQFDMYAQVLVGTNLWAVSNTNTVRFSRTAVPDGILRFSSTYRPNRTVEVYEHTTDDDRFLLCVTGRICKIGDGVVPSFEVEAGTDILKVTFSDNSPPVRFNISEGKVIP